MSYAVLTDAGRQKLEDACGSHLASVKALFESHYDENELRWLADLLERLAADDEPCPGACGTGSGPDG